MHQSDWHRELAAEDEEERAVARDFVEGALGCDAKRFASAIERLLDDWLDLHAAFRRIGRETAVPLEMRKRFVTIWFNQGERFRSRINDDHVLADGLRALMPPYRSRRSVVIYRGESAWNRRRRTYGLCWSHARTVAEQHAERQRKLYKDGSVLVQTIAPPEAIIAMSRNF